MYFVFLHLASGRRQQDDREVTSLCHIQVYLLRQPAVATDRQTYVAYKEVAPEFVDGVFPQLVEFDLLRKDIKWHVDRSP